MKIDICQKGRMFVWNPLFTIFLNNNNYIVQVLKEQLLKVEVVWNRRPVWLGQLSCYVRGINLNTLDKDE